MENTTIKTTVPTRKIKIKKIGKKHTNNTTEKVSVVQEARQEAAQEAPQKSIWMSMRRAPQTALANIVRMSPPIECEGIEDISDDENDTPEAAAERLEKMKIEYQQFQDRIKEAERLDRLESEEIFGDWNRGGLFKTHTNYDYEVINTLAYPINA